jgi:hypothetical protein
MHNAAMVDPLNPHVRRIKDINSKGSKKLTDSDREEMQRLEWAGSLYWDEKLGLHIPSENIEKCIREGATKSRLGKAAEAASFVTDPVVKLDCGKYPMDLDKLYELSEYQFRKPVRIPPKTGARIMKVRPVIPTGWKLTFVVEFDDSVINSKDIVKAMIDAGALVGLGDWRPKFGRFTVEVSQ